MATDEPVGKRTRSRIEDIEAARDLSHRMDLLHNRLLRLVPRSEPEVKVESEPKAINGNTATWTEDDHQDVMKGCASCGRSVMLVGAGRGRWDLSHLSGNDADGGIYPDEPYIANCDTCGALCCRTCLDTEKEGQCVLCKEKILIGVKAKKRPRMDRHRWQPRGQPHGEPRPRPLSLAPE